MQWMYPEVIHSLINDCNAYMSGEIDLQTMQRAIYLAEHQIVSLEERWLRQELFIAENKIEEILYTVDDSNRGDAAEYIVRRLMYILNLRN